MTIHLIDPNKKYKTGRGHPVTIHKIVPMNCCGSHVTYPVKGTIHITKRKTEYAIWTITGKSNVAFPNSLDDLMLC